ncbi:chromosome segregation protein SMC [uncultured Pseudoteredinibacter sp.]|uniref:chromosome segregation protein SMC n=1 Tax=uncultured Pseudoteredinibacter sp. TaxID=1641701 RepID=UPI00262BD017|nr:chromosome segregation protein SMC [uncultured Pseudoteredinibacter sp.]
MRLKCIKLAGFKSFVDPTTVSFPSNLCAIVGPNGCGKSNTIDAVRWVMGESSAKNLRGESMTDVIFNGSGGRKPVGQASIELIFDNSDGTLVGEYAGYSEISVKRKVTRDATNTYYLNGNKCRRRDITDIFLGTGLGPRSYAIIEQGMISRLIEAKPEELRVYIEEAAGISKYKERRRDTENRMRRTMENLERLTDIRDELERQLSRLERQSVAAEKYTEFKKEERLLKAQLQALRFQLLDEQAKSKQGIITELELKVESFVTDQVGKDTEIEEYRLQHTEMGDKFNEVQGRFYALGSEIARIEQNIQHAQSRSQELQRDLEQTERDCKEAEQHLLTDTEKTKQWEEELLEIEPELEMIKAAEEDSGDFLQTAEDAMQDWQIEWDSFNQTAAEPRQRAEVEQSKIQHLEQVQSRLLDRIKRLDEERGNLQSSEVDEEIAELSERMAELDIDADAKRAAVEEMGESINEQREQSNSDSETLDQLRNQLSSMRGRHASLEALQQAAMGQQNEAVSEWLSEQGLADKPRLAEQLQVEAGWEMAVETALGNHLQAVCTDGIDDIADVFAKLDQGELVLLDANSGKAAVDSKSLANFVSGSADVSHFLANVLAAENISEALAMRSSLSAGQSVMTKEGIWVGANWMRVAKDNDAASGVLARKQELEELTAAIAELEEQVEQLSDAMEQRRDNIKDLEQQREAKRREAEDLNRRYGEMRSQVSAKQVQVEQTSMRRQRLDSEITEAKEQMDAEAEALSESRMVLQEAIDAMEQDTDKREELLGKRDELREKLDQARQRARHDKDRGHELAIRYQSLRTQLDSMRSGIERLRDQVQRSQDRREQLQATLGENRDPIEEYKMELEERLEDRLSVEGELADARRAVDDVEAKLRQIEQDRSKAEHEIQSVRTRLEQERLFTREVEVQRSTVETQLVDDGFHLPTLLEQLPEDAEEKAMEEELERIGNRISRLGPINLAAIDEYKTESERKTYLDTQNKDLEDALETLENAIKKIDKETRSRFKETFDQVNESLQELFPKVFGGGHAYLELTGDDLLDTGIAIMARPPGKRNSTIHLLSGGEKALTAIALVFSIFRLNPAPFCILDEVDAPLDDANVGRYARMVEEMSKHVQFIYITHNKIAMEMAHQLLGVTMHEPGVSRLVSVDVDEAAELAAM